MAKPTLLLIDGNSLAFRAFYALINQVDRFVNHEGLHTNALVGFNNLLDGIIEPFNPDLALVAWDAGKTTFRTGKFDNYKGNRDNTPQERSEEHTSELQSRFDLVCRLLLEKKNRQISV